MEFKEFNEINKDVLRPTEYILKGVSSSFVLHQKCESRLDAVIKDMKKFIKRFNNDFSDENYNEDFDLPVIFSYAMTYYSGYGESPFTREQMKRLAELSDNYSSRRMTIIGVVFLSLESLGAIDGADDKRLNPFEEIFLKRLEQSVTDEERMMVIGMTIYSLTVDYENEGKYIGEEGNTLEIPSLVSMETMMPGYQSKVSDDPLE